jgi:hypothetical protein
MRGIKGTKIEMIPKCKSLSFQKLELDDYKPITNPEKTKRLRSSSDRTVFL